MLSLSIGLSLTSSILGPLSASISIVFDGPLSVGDDDEAGTVIAQAAVAGASPTFTLTDTAGDKFAITEGGQLVVGVTALTVGSETIEVTASTGQVQTFEVSVFQADIPVTPDPDPVVLDPAVITDVDDWEARWHAPYGWALNHQAANGEPAHWQWPGDSSSDFGAEQMYALKTVGTEDVEDQSDVEILVDFKLYQNPGFLAAAARCSGEAGSENGYLMTGEYANSRPLRLLKYLDGAVTVVATGSGAAFPLNVRCLMRYRVTGNRHLGRWWPEDSEEPENWFIDYTDESDPVASGEIGLSRLFDRGSRVFGYTYQTLLPQLSSVPEDLSFLDDTVADAVLAEFTVTGGTGTYTFSLPDDDGGRFAISSDGVLTAASTLTSGDRSLVININNGSESINRSVIVFVADTAGLLSDKGQGDPALHPGPTDVTPSVTTARGTVLAATGSGVVRYVDAAASGANNGASLVDAYTTISAAMTASGAGDLVLIKGGNYRETVNIPFPKKGTASDKITFSRYGTEQPVIKGSEVLTGWTACTDQADALGSPNWADCYTAFVPAGHLFDDQGYAGETPQNGVGLNLTQDDELLYLPLNGPGYTSYSTLKFRNDNKKYYGGGLTPADDEITNTTAFDRYTSLSDLENVYLYAYYPSGGNNVRLNKVTGFDNSTKTVTIDNASSHYNGQVALYNDGQDMIYPGMWCFKENLEPDGSRKVVVYPKDGADLSASAATVEYTDRSTGFRTSEASHITLFGINVASVSGVAIGTSGVNSVDRTGVVYEQCKAINTVAISDLAQAIRMINGINCHILDCSSINSQGSGFYQDRGDYYSVQNCLVDGSSRTGLSTQHVRNSLYAFNDVINTIGVHTNGVSFYSPGIVDDETNRCLIFGNRIRTNGGIAFTHSDGGNMYFMMNDIICPKGEGQHRGLENNSTREAALVDRGTEDEELEAGNIIIMNQTSAPEDGVDLTASHNGLATGVTGNQTHHLVNSIWHGNGEFNRGYSQNESFPAVEGTYANNVCTGLYSGQMPGDGFFTGPKCDFVDGRTQAGLDAIFADQRNQDYTPVASGVLDGAGASHAALRALIEADFPAVNGSYPYLGFDINRYIDGTAIADWDDVNIGAYPSAS